MRQGFSVTYELVTPESAESGDVEERGFVAKSNYRIPLDNIMVLEWEEYIDLSLREAIALVFEAQGNTECIEENCSDWEHASWVTVVNAPSMYTGVAESRSIHFPDNTTAASRKRLVRLLTK